MRRLSRRAGVGGLGLAVVTVALAVPAWAYFSVTSTAATASGRAATLGTPAVATSGVTASTVTFTVTAPSAGPTPTGYRVARTAPTAAPSACTVTGANGSCTDTAPVAGQTNTYAVYAVLAGSAWESPVPATASVAVPSADTTPPVTTVSQSPAPNGAGWSTTDVTVTLTATDASGVAGTWYTTDGTAPTTSSTPYAGPFTVSSSTTVRYFSQDKVGNTEAAKSVSVQIDRTAPSVAVTGPAGGSTQGGTVTVSGTASDTGSGVAGVTVQYRTGSAPWTTIGSPTTSGGSWSTSWATAGLADGSYSLQAIGTDTAGNSTTSAAVPVTLRNTFTVTAPSTATAGTAFTVTLSTYPGYSGTKSLTVTGLQSSPSGATPSVPSSATFSGGTATISVTPVRSGVQAVTVTDAGLSSLTGTSAPVSVNAGSPTRLAWTTFTAQGSVQSTSTCYFTCAAVIGNNIAATSNVSVTDPQGNIVSDLGSAKTVTVSAPPPKTGSPAGQQVLTIPASGPATSASQWTYTESGNWSNRSFTATSSGLTQATLTVSKQ
ncbi:OmpL47-type beta-barrel domain-containing protein [Pedococcus sp. NPDC057267]|uniref:OmpL47-type beta-barrel domain-containing protein n=1 Tax=Pedococcus sp. NPDC057267 TaxID=3346077 RepID=UPI0036259492